MALFQQKSWLVITRKDRSIKRHVHVNAVLAAEDDNFFDHSGVSYSGLIRSAYRLLTSGRIQGGGSTITMQVAGNYLTSRDISLFRKIKDIFLAYRLERAYTKEEILKSYKKIMKKIHPDVSPELSRLASIVNEAKDKVLEDIK